MITNDDDGMIRAALQHVGIIQHFDFAVKALVERGELVRILQPWSQPFPGFYLYIPPVSTCLPRSGRCWTFWSRSAQASRPARRITLLLTLLRHLFGGDFALLIAEVADHKVGDRRYFLIGIGAAERRHHFMPIADADTRPLQNGLHHAAPLRIVHRRAAHQRRILALAARPVPLVAAAAVVSEHPPTERTVLPTRQDRRGGPAPFGCRFTAAAPSPAIGSISRRYFTSARLSSGVRNCRLFSTASAIGPAALLRPAHGRWPDIATAVGRSSRQCRSAYPA